MKKISLILVCIICFTQVKAQRFTPFPDHFTAKGIYVFSGNFIGIYGYYTQENTRYFSLLQCSAADSATLREWIASAYDKPDQVKDSLLKRYYNQLFTLRVASNGNVGSRFENDLHYVYNEFENYSKTDSLQIYLDSIPQASGINDVIICNDTLFYASVINNNKNYIVRKKGKQGSWQTLPVVVPKKGSLDTIWYIFLCSGIMLCGLAFIFYRRFISTGKAIIAEMNKDNEVYNKLKLAADRPLDYDQLDPVKDKDTKDAIDAIVGVIQNGNTPLPMTIAVNGAWGSGKSTIMNCIRQKLDVDNERRFITTWFNAWHQQSESSLLNAFLLKIINRYERPFFKDNSLKAGVAFMRFRLRLASSRFTKWSFYNQILSGFALTFLLAMILIIIVNLYGKADLAIFKQMGFTNLNIATLFKDGSMKSLEIISPVILLVLSVCSFFILKSEPTPTIGAFLNVMYKKSFLVDAEKNNPDMREKFRTQYWEIMAAVEDRVLIVFIDDLDRVNGDKIFEMLEAINFIGDITSRPDDSNNQSLKTIFVLGLYTDQVAEQLGTFLQKDNPFREKQDTEKARLEAKVLGKRYIEKMVQLNVPVPLNDKGK
jgi:KAP family P-loop domain